MVGARRAVWERSALMGPIGPCFARTQTWLQAGKYINALVSGLPSPNEYWRFHTEREHHRLYPGIKQRQYTLSA